LLNYNKICLLNIDTSQYNWFVLQQWQLPPEGRLVYISINKKNCFLGNYKKVYYAGNSKCPHANGDLSKGYLSSKGEIVCPLHRFKFNLASGKETTGNGGFCVTTYPVKQAQDGEYYIGFLKPKSWFGL